MKTCIDEGRSPLDVKAVVGHHAMPAALLFLLDESAILIFLSENQTETHFVI